jgi:uncharacterized membrane protein YgdD (TMEM256/DUF423 family)
MSALFTGLGALLGLLAVAFGAFGAHALQRRLPVDLLAIFETAVRYQMYHALALLFVGAWAARAPSATLNAAGWLFFAGVALFSGSLYILALSGVRVLGAVTPFGGLCFLAAWALFAWSAFHSR